MSRFLVVTLAVIGAVLFSQGIYMDAKAKLAQVLIESSWKNRTQGHPPPKPWWWADTRAIARLEVPRLKQTLYVMQDDSGESLAFGPGHMTASAKPAHSGHVMIAGHRDSHFRFLKDVKIGDTIQIDNHQSEHKRYQITEIFVFDANTQELPLLDQDQLTLITCYPFESFVPGGPLRLIVNASPI